MKKLVFLVIVIVLMSVLFGVLKIFFIGEQASSESLAVRVEEGDGQLTIYMQSTDSAMALSDIDYKYVGTVLHMTVQKVLSSPLHNKGEICLYYEIIDETEVWLNGKLIWSK